MTMGPCLPGKYLTLDVDKGRCPFLFLTATYLVYDRHWVVEAAIKWSRYGTKVTGYDKVDISKALSPLAIELRAKELVIDYFFWGQRNKEAFLRKRVERNKNLPRSEQRGPGGTSIPTLRSYLNKALKKYDDMPICASLKKAGPDHAEEMFRSVMDRARQYFKEKS